MELRIERATKRMIVGVRVAGKGREVRNKEAGRWVSTIAFMRPARREREEAKRVPRVDANLSFVNNPYLTCWGFIENSEGEQTKSQTLYPLVYPWVKRTSDPCSNLSD